MHVQHCTPLLVTHLVDDTIPRVSWGIEAGRTQGQHTQPSDSNGRAAVWLRVAKCSSLTAYTRDADADADAESIQILHSPVPCTSTSACPQSALT
jgi:hypothetical protein